MRRFLRYVLYREGYRALREALRAAGSDADGPTDDTRTAETTDPTAAAGVPADGSPVETPAQLKAVLQQMDPYEFEHFVADLWERFGWETSVSSASADKGVDVVCRKSMPYDQLVLIQAKRYGPNSTVGSPAVQQYASLRHQYDGVDKVLIVTTNGYSSQAESIADKLNVKLIDGDRLVRLILDHDALDLVASSLDFIEPAGTATAQDTAGKAGAAGATETAGKTGKAEAAGTADTAETAGTADTAETAGAAETAGTADTAETAGAAETAGTTTHSAADSAPTGSDDPTRPASDPGILSTVGQGLVAVSVPGWIAVLAGVSVLSDAGWGSVFLLAWVAAPVGILLDTRALGPERTWPTHRWLYVLTSLVWLVAVIPASVYLWRRRKLA